MTDNDKLEVLFERVLREVGGPIVDAHALAEADGFIMDREGVPEGHANNMIAMGLVVSGLVCVRPDEDGEWVMIKDGDHTWLTSMLLDREGARSLVKDLQAILSEENQV